jgi:hypothetical protein
MANKNTRQVRTRVGYASRKGKESVEVARPVGNYHSNPSTTNITIPCACANRNGVVSGSARRNTQMRVLHNTGSTGLKESVTVHEATNSELPVRFKNHAYIVKRGEYKQPREVR